MTGYTRARADWIDWPDTSTIVRAQDFDQWDQTLYELRHQTVDIRDYGTVSAPGAALQAAINDLGTAGGTIMLPPETLTWESVPTIPPGITGRLHILGSGRTRITLTANGQRFLDFGKTADHDTFQNIEVSNLLIDCNNIGGRHHVILGCYANGVTLTRVNLKQIYLHDIKTINVPVDATLANHRLNVWLVTTQPLAGEGTQNVVQSIRVHRVRCEGETRGSRSAARSEAERSLGSTSSSTRSTLTVAGIR
jgi:hypothetical protein